MLKNLLWQSFPPFSTWGCILWFSNLFYRCSVFHISIKNLNDFIDNILFHFIDLTFIYWTGFLFEFSDFLVCCIHFLFLEFSYNHYFIRFMYFWFHYKLHIFQVLLSFWKISASPSIISFFSSTSVKQFLLMIHLFTFTNVWRSYGESLYLVFSCYIL